MFVISSKTSKVFTSVPGQKRHHLCQVSRKRLSIRVSNAGRVCLGPPLVAGQLQDNSLFLLSANGASPLVHVLKSQVQTLLMTHVITLTFTLDQFVSPLW